MQNWHCDLGPHFEWHSGTGYVVCKAQCKMKMQPLLSVSAVHRPRSSFLDSAHSGLLKDIAPQSPFYRPAAGTVLALSGSFHGHESLRWCLPIREEQTTRNALDLITRSSCLSISVLSFVVETTQIPYPCWLEEGLHHCLCCSVLTALRTGFQTHRSLLRLFLS